MSSKHKTKTLWRRRQNNNFTKKKTYESQTNSGYSGERYKTNQVEYANANLAIKG